MTYIWSASRTIVSFGFLILGLTQTYAQEFEVLANLSCTAMSDNPAQSPPFSSAIEFKVSNDRISGIRLAGRRPGREVYSGTIDSVGMIKIFGRGGYFDSNYTWTSIFSGSIKQGEKVRIKGVMQSVRGGRRDCVITVLEAPVALIAKYDPSRAIQQSATPSSVEKKSELKQDPAIPPLQQQQQSQQMELEQQKLEQQQIANAQRELKESQIQLAKQQTGIKDQVNWVQNVLGGIILPPSEDPSSWMLRVAAVPVQQQQFCRIVDQFYDRLADVYKARNEIKRNALYRDRKLTLATLLPRGEFQNWVVQIKEVTQAPDGSAAVMLQPPCRAMLGSDACQKNGSKIRATIPTTSVMFRELERVSAGDFVVVSGKILYAESADGYQPLPSYAIYQAGSHCSAASEGKQNDVFVTEIGYLVQLR